jgi:hypothetical protein
MQGKLDLWKNPASEKVSLKGIQKMTSISIINFLFSQQTKSEHFSINTFEAIL